MRKGPYLGLITFVAILLSTIPAGAQNEQWLQYRSARELRQVDGGLSLVQLSVNTDRPDGVEMPEFSSETVVFARWSTPMVESGGLWLALGRTSDSGAFDTLYIDSNGDGRLDDETPIKAYRMDQYNAYFGPVKVIFQVEDGPVTYHMNVRFYGSGANRRLYVSAGGWYQGDITVGDVRKRCVLLDYNANGTFNDTSADPGQSDRIRISDENALDMRFVGTYLEIDGTLYDLDIARDGAFVKLAKAQDVRYGTVRVPQGISSFSAGGEYGQFIREPENGSAELPAGRYRVTEWTVDRRDDSGARWILQGTDASGANAFDLPAMQKIALEIGEPVKAILETGVREETYSFNQNLRGRRGERITLTHNGARPTPPRLNIRNKDGTYDRTFSFSYG